MKVLMEPIQVCAIWDTEGNIRPLAVCMEEEDKKIKISVETVCSWSEEKIVGHLMMNFSCNVIWNGQRRMVSLRYDLNKHRWYLYKA